MAYDSRPPKQRDPATDPSANYDYQSDSVHRPDLVAALERRVDGDVRFDTYTRELFATDASAYEQLPIGVVSPVSTDDVVAVMEYCAEEGIPVLPRGGGTSLAGQAVNEAVVLDFKRHMDETLSVDPEARRARAQVGITIARLNDRLEPHGLKFAPDPAWGDKSVLGGAIGNNTTGAHSLKYGKTDAYIEECEVVLADGTQTTFGWVDVADLESRAAEAGPDADLETRIYAEVAKILAEDAEEIDARYPELKRNVSGYNLDELIDSAEERGEVNLARLLAGSEGTLAVVTEATVSLEPVPDATAVAMLTYDDIISAMEDVAPILDHDPSAVEVMDDVLLDLAAETPEFADVVGMLPEKTDSTLLVEFYADSADDGAQKVADLLADRLPDYDARESPRDGAGSVTDAPVNAVDALEAYDADRQAKFWKMRKAGLPILLSRTGDDKHWPFVEDTAVPAENLPEYVADIRDLFDEHETFASYYAHAGPGVLHIRPLLNLKSEDGIETMEAISDAITDLVVQYDGSVSGEHGDGRARTQWNRKLYGDDLWETFRDLKSAFDPDWRLNPGNICGDHDPAENLRYDPDYAFDAGFEPTLDWDNENGLQGMVELCHGCAGCTGHQETTGGVMCPTYRAAEEEITSTRGRANMLRSAMDGDLPDDPFEEEFVTEVLDLCIGCKGCKKDCPSGVDMAKLKAEVVHEHHQREGISLRDRLFANVETVLSLGSTFAPVSNWLMELPGSGFLMENTVGITQERTLPAFHRTTFRDWWADRGGALVAANKADRKALLLADPYTNYSHPDVGKAAVQVLEAAGVHVVVPDGVTDSGRPAFSKSMLDHARETARANVDALAPRIRDGWDVVTIEPSDAVMYQVDYRDLLSGDDVERVAANTYGVCEYLDTFRLGENISFDESGDSLAYHGHCHQKATKKDHHAVGVLRRAGYTVDPLDSGCCGMAGSFGYEAEHYSMSEGIADLLLGQIDDSPAGQVVAPGASCRSQIDDFGDGDTEPPHPIELVAAAIR
ncbi:FAD-binding oxidoreductase [Haloarcula sp. CBA1130]|uniref:FAD-binding and (Fe-S)-binding domain-containing protein n=1 Tax=unclassified Haloarcula TaxID=2624677 RepID=UPI001247B62E|nr:MULTISPECIES: FAD-binding and (Fe-S)-binding domain-containing protein [unclassified Haloarcula]KAA9395958.1 FAD-binding oxidoreductase [Haloarcula sp. CBA1129]KAA9400111.1 FAD-binding oxidoreductase [Haloarcula sp. CBA1130]